MNETIRTAAISPLRQRMIDDMNVRRFSHETQRNYIRDVGRFATFLGGSPDTATPDDVRQFQIDQREAGVPTPTMNSIVSALRFFFTQTIDRPDLARKLVRAAAHAAAQLCHASAGGRRRCPCHPGPAPPLAVGVYCSAQAQHTVHRSRNEVRWWTC